MDPRKTVDPDEALEKLNYEKQAMITKMDAQVILRLLVNKGVVTREEVRAMREEVRNSPIYKPQMDDIEAKERGYQRAKAHPEEYLKAYFNAKFGGKSQ